MNKWWGSFFAVVVLVGILQFFDVPKVLNYVLLGEAVILGGVAIYQRFKGADHT